VTIKDFLEDIFDKNGPKFLNKYGQMLGVWELSLIDSAGGPVRVGPRFVH